MGVPNIDALMTQIDTEEIQLEQQRQVQQAAMMDAMKNGALMGGDENGGKPPGARNGSSQSLPPDLKTVAKGNPAPERNGPKPAR
jgi:hypothetical protein